VRDARPVLTGLLQAEDQKAGQARRLGDRNDAKRTRSRAIGVHDASGRCSQLCRVLSRSETPPPEGLHLSPEGKWRPPAEKEPLARPREYQEGLERQVRFACQVFRVLRQECAADSSHFSQVRRARTGSSCLGHAGHESPEQHPSQHAELTCPLGFLRRPRHSRKAPRLEGRQAHRLRPLGERPMAGVREVWYSRDEGPWRAAQRKPAGRFSVAHKVWGHLSVNKCRLAGVGSGVG